MIVKIIRRDPTPNPVEIRIGSAGFEVWLAAPTRRNRK